MRARQSDVLRLRDIELANLGDFLSAYGLTITMVDGGAVIPGSHWGDAEAGLIRHNLYVRLDTPVHSALHEACHWLLMDEQRRATLHTDAGGSAVEESAVCYLQIVLSDHIPEMGRTRMCRDMDQWGYSFRLGSTARWFEEDADDAIEFLQKKGFGVLLSVTSENYLNEQ